MIGFADCGGTKRGVSPLPSSLKLPYLNVAPPLRNDILFFDAVSQGGIVPALDVPLPPRRLPPLLSAVCVSVRRRVYDDLYPASSLPTRSFYKH